MRDNKKKYRRRIKAKIKQEQLKATRNNKNNKNNKNNEQQ